MVIGGDSCSRGRELESQQWILSHRFILKIVLFASKRPNLINTVKAAPPVTQMSELSHPTPEDPGSNPSTVITLICCNNC